MFLEAHFKGCMSRRGKTGKASSARPLSVAAAGPRRAVFLSGKMRECMALARMARGEGVANNISYGHLLLGAFSIKNDDVSVRAAVRHVHSLNERLYVGMLVCSASSLVKSLRVWRRGISAVIGQSLLKYRSARKFSITRHHHLGTG